MLIKSRPRRVSDWTVYVTPNFHPEPERLHNCLLTFSFNIVSTCCFFLWLNRPMGTKEMSRLTGLLALQSALSSERRSLTYPKSACFQKISRAVSSECVLTSQENKKAQIIMSDAWPKKSKTNVEWHNRVIWGTVPARVSSGANWIAKALPWVTVLLITPT